MSVPRSEYTTAPGKPFRFRPPKTSRPLVRAVQRLLPLLARLDAAMVPVDVEPADLDRLRALRGRRVVLAPNHPEGVEPYVLFALSAMLRDQFHYIAAKEAFEQPPPPFRWLAWLRLYAPVLQRLGVYSVVRGTADRDCFATTRKLLVEGERWLVIFPEGEVGWQGETLMPLQPGVAQFGFWALEELNRAGDPPPLYFVPVAIRFRFRADVRPGIDRALERLERALRITPSASASTRYERLRRVGEAVLATNERRYGLRPPADALLADRIAEIKELMMARITGALGVAQDRGQPIMDRVRELFNALDRIVHEGYGDEGYERRVRQIDPAEARSLYGELSRMQHLAALRDGYVRETLSAERFYDVLGQLEWEVFRNRSSWGPRRAMVKVGLPINLTDRLAAYRSDRRAAREQVTRKLEAALREMLAALSTGAQVIDG